VILRLSKTLTGYYTEILSANNLKRCYDIAPQRVRQYLQAEVNYVIQFIKPEDSILELGCGYGRILPELAGKAGSVTGIDISLSSIELGRRMLSNLHNCMMMQMDAVNLVFPDNSFDVVICIQNGISAFHVDPLQLIHESIRVTKPGGLILFSSYSEKFWNYRLEWFKLQSVEGLIGEIDFYRTRNGRIVCKDGFTADTIKPEQFIKLTSGIQGINVRIEEVDESSIFCRIEKAKA
jgi:ubiquinone/menaquinone biosynthesis C-methylase UbiE